jgi:hypothetical protein
MLIMGFLIASHFVIDGITSRLSHYFWEVRDDRHNTFVVIGFDQFLHVAIIVMLFFFVW